MIIYDEFDKLQLVRSDERYIIRRDDGIEMYEDLIKPGAHTYVETDRKIGEKQDYETAMKILLGQEV